MLTSVKLQDFKNHIDTEIRLGRLTCLVGPNGCGKTSVLEAVQFACTSLNHGAVSFFQPPRVFEDFIRRGAESLGVGLEYQDGQGESSLSLQLTLLRGKPYIHSDLRERYPFLPDYNVRTDWHCNADREQLLREVEAGELSDDFATYGAKNEMTVHEWRPYGLLPQYSELLANAFMFTPDIRSLRLHSYSPEEVPSLGSTGSVLASVIAYLITAEPERFADLTQRIRDVLPFVERLRVRPAKVELTEPTTITVNRKEIPYWENREVIGHELLFDLRGAPGVPARAVSEGTLLVTALLTATVWSRGAGILLIDDLEKGLHPKAQREMVQALNALLDADPKLQVVFSTHSPYVVDELEAEQVWILVPDEQRGVVARQLSDHPRAADALEVLTTGEFLSAEGEDWVLDAAPRGASS